MQGQMNIFEYMDEVSDYRYCKNCKRAKYKERCAEIELWWCNDTRQYITEASLDWMCKKSKGHSLYERR